ncbi:caspase family protein, partial [Bradyrhizobium sp. 147]|uniref:caspase family protein n=1 Tax=Bradyrhizobium sp. 147 TaxID=2782623 RepID=UPI001FF9F1D7
MKRVHSLTRIAAVGFLAILLSVGFSSAMRYEAVKKLEPQTHSLIEGANTDDGESNQLALIVDDSNYPDAEAPLDQTAHDATGLAAALNAKGFSVDLLANGTRAQTFAATERLKAKVRPGSTVLVCQSAFDWDPLSASKRDPFDRRALLGALGSSELV